MDVEKALEESGLVMIQTDPNKAKEVAPAPEPQVIPRAPRPRRPPPPDTGPLEIVETQKNV
ncbi:MAG: ribonuclease E [Burkholderiales bacterium]|nr:ribonuclease E [Burkholderiales bacterium]